MYVYCKRSCKNLWPRQSDNTGSVGSCCVAFWMLLKLSLYRYLSQSSLLWIVPRRVFILFYSFPTPPPCRIWLPSIFVDVNFIKDSMGTCFTLEECGKKQIFFFSAAFLFFNIKGNVLQKYSTGNWARKLWNPEYLDSEVLQHKWQFESKPFAWIKMF